MDQNKRVKYVRTIEALKKLTRKNGMPKERLTGNGKELPHVAADPGREDMAGKKSRDEAERNAKLARERLRMLRLINNELPKKEDLCELRRLHEQALAAYMRWVRLYGEPECEARGCHCV